ncbi:DNA polymerase [Mycobacterium paragordonae]|uniref:DNA polymerase n=1 Tax=Mycobacterium paragordonae TaxID=1389713 RepID=UPI003FCE3D9D
MDPADPRDPGVTPDGRVHPTYHQTISATGALSASGPNLRGVSAGFRAGAGYAGLLTARYDALEIRLLAHLSGDIGVLDAAAADPYPARTVSRALAYGWTAGELAAALKISRGDAKEVAAQHLSDLVRTRLAGVVDDAHELGYAATLSGRRRYLPDLNSPDPVLRDAAQRAGCATVLQGGVADVVKAAMVNVGRAIKAAGLASRMVAQVDDRLVFEVTSGERDAVATLVCEQMACAYQLDVPLSVSVAR